MNKKLALSLLLSVAPLMHAMDANEQAKQEAKQAKIVAISEQIDSASTLFAEKIAMPAGEILKMFQNGVKPGDVELLKELATNINQSAQKATKTFLEAFIEDPQVQEIVFSGMDAWESAPDQNFFTRLAAVMRQNADNYFDDFRSPEEPGGD